MAKKQKHAAADAPVENVAVDTPAEASPIGLRGPKGASLEATITVKATDNPKRPGSRAHTLWTLYRDGMTVKEYLDACEAAGHGAIGTPALQYDTSHGFIEIAGYDPKVKIAPKPKKEPKAPKAKKEKVAPAEEVVVDDTEVVE